MAYNKAVAKARATVAAATVWESSEWWGSSSSSSSAQPYQGGSSWGAHATNLDPNGEIHFRYSRDIDSWFSIFLAIIIGAIVGSIITASYLTRIFRSKREFADAANTAAESRPEEETPNVAIPTVIHDHDEPQPEDETSVTAGVEDNLDANIPANEPEPERVTHAERLRHISQLRGEVLNALLVAQSNRVADRLLRYEHGESDDEEPSDPDDAAFQYFFRSLVSVDSSDDENEGRALMMLLPDDGE